MSESKYPIGDRLAADIARFLDEAQVPHVIFGYRAVGLFGRRRHNYREVDFVIPDSKLEQAIRALDAHGFAHCVEPECRELKECRVPRPNPPRGDKYHHFANAHVHLPERVYPDLTVFSLYAQSSMLWWMPDLNLEPVAANDDTFIYTNDARLPPSTKYDGSSPWTDLYPVKSLTPSSLAEALIMLWCRDYGHVNWEKEQMWEILWSLLLVRDIRGNNDFILDDNHIALREHIGPEFLPVLDAFLLKDAVPEDDPYIYRPLRRLRDRLVAEDKLGRLPPIDLDGKV